MHIKKGDNVIIRSGKDSGKTGKVIRVFPKENKVLIEGANMMKKRERPKRQGTKGQTVSVPTPMNASRVLIMCSSCKKGVRTGVMVNGDSKNRICRSCKNNI